MSDARLSMEITMTSGRGYVPAEKNKQHQTSIGVIPVDSIYTPVYKVNYTVENTRVRDLTDYDKLTLEVSRPMQPSTHATRFRSVQRFCATTSICS